eukprot:jgi/Chrzof1/9985/Cz04g23010.t1
MPPVFKKPKEYDPSLAKKTLGEPATESTTPPESDNRRLLIELGLEDDNDDSSSTNTTPHGEIGAFYPGTAPTDNVNKNITRFQERTADCVELLQSGTLDRVGADQVQDLLLDLQHQVELLQRGNNSLRTSMSGMRRVSKDMQVGVNKESSENYEARIKMLEQQLAEVQQQQPQPVAAAAAGTMHLDKEIKTLQAAIHSGEADTTKLTADLSAMSAANSALNEQLVTLTTQKDQLASHLETVKTSTQADGAGLQQQVQQLLSEQQHMVAELHNLQKQYADVKASESELLQQLQEVTSEKQQLSLHLQQLGQQQFSGQTDLLTVRQQLQQAEVEVKRLQTQMADLLQGQQTGSQENEKLKQELLQVQGSYGAAQQQLQKSALQVSKLENDVQQLQASQKAGSADLATMKEHYAAAQQQLAGLESDKKQLQDKLVQALEEQKKVHQQTMADMQQLRTAAETAQTALAKSQAVFDAKLLAYKKQATEQVEEYKQRWQSEFDKRRKLHNQVVELKGNIRVLARVRPLLEKENGSNSTSTPYNDLPVHATSEETLELSSATDRTDKVYEFDKVFAPSAGQEQVFEEVSALVSSVLDGYNVCIMAYGQTGSGKTFTMEGPSHDPGVNTRALRELFRGAAERQAQVAYSFAASVLEIYNEQIFDLLSGSRDSGDKLDVKEGPEGMFVPGLRMEEVINIDELMAALQKGKQNRSTFSTNMNEHSSRSHLVLSMYVRGQRKDTGASWRAKLHLIDLAGSERLSRTGAQGDRLKEAQSINKSLSALGDVIQALQQRSSHIPYRNSKAGVTAAHA